MSESHRKPLNLADQLRLGLKYQEFLGRFEHRPPLTGCEGPPSFEEWANLQLSYEALKNVNLAGLVEALSPKKRKKRKKAKKFKP